MKRPSGSKTADVATPRAEESARDRVRRQRKARKRRRVLRVVVPLLLVVAVVAGGYAWGKEYFSSHYYPKTSVAGIDASGMTEDELVKAFGDAVTSYSCVITRDSLQLEFAGSNIDLTANAAETAKALLAAQDAQRWPLEFLRGSARSSKGITFNAKKVWKLVRKAVKAYNKTATAPESAQLRRAKGTDQFSIEKEKLGTTLDANACMERVRAAVEMLQTRVKLGDDVLERPEYVADSAPTKEALARANHSFDLVIPLARDGKTIVKLDADVFGPWLVCDGMDVAVDQEQASEYIDQVLWRQMDYNDDQSAYAVDAAALAAALSDYVRTGGGDPIHIPYVATERYLPGDGALNPAKWESGQGRYLDINKTAQVATLFDSSGKVLWETPVTTGNEKANNGTPTGEFDIYDKVSDFMLIGEDHNNDGKPDYELHVDFWMPFNGNIGLHDASWRKEYGGDRYLEHGSGGCVNLPKKAAKALFAMVHVGDVVIVHN